MTAKARKPLVGPKKEKAPPASRAAAVGFFALLPIAVALGVVVGRGGSDGGDSDALLQALRAQEATAAPAAGPSAAAGNKKKKTKSAKAERKGEGKVTHTDHGDVHEVTNFKASEEKKETDTQLVEENPEQVGDDYIKAQQNLPDVIVVGEDASGGPAPGSGVEP
jgi:hypothetical protein